MGLKFLVGQADRCIMKKLLSITYRGFSLVEVLVATVIGGVVVMGSLESLRFAMQAGSVSKAILTENDFKLTLSNAVDKNCTANFSPTTTQITGTHKAKGIGQVNKLFLEGDDPDTDSPIIQVGTFKGDIEVVKMELTGDNSEDTAGGGDFKREFIAYYKKNNLGDLNTVSGLDCDPSDQSGCFKTQCKLNYSFGDDPETDGDQTDHFTGCQSLTCHPVVLQVAGSRFPCKWGELYRPGATPECDKREGTEGGCDKPTGSKFIGDEKTSRVEENGKCICKKSTRIKTVDGLCMTRRKSYGSAECWPRSDNYDFDNHNNKTTWNTAMYNFCSKEYQGTEACIWREVYDMNAPGDFNSVLLRPGKIQYFKRVYNRETGEVDCHVAERKYTVAHSNCSDSTNGKHCERFVKIGKSRIFKQRQIPESWFMPQTQ